MQVPNLQFNVPPMIQLPNEMQGFTDALLQASQTRQQRLLDEQARADMKEQREFERDVTTQKLDIAKEGAAISREDATRRQELHPLQVDQAQMGLDLQRIQVDRVKQEMAYDQSFGQFLQENGEALQGMDPMQQQIFISEATMADPNAPLSYRKEAAERIYEIAMKNRDMAMQDAKFESDMKMANMNYRIAEMKLAQANAALNMENVGLNKDQIANINQQIGFVEKQAEGLQKQATTIQASIVRNRDRAAVLATTDPDKFPTFMQNDRELQNMMAGMGINTIDREAVRKGLEQIVTDDQKRLNEIEGQIAEFQNYQSQMIQATSQMLRAPNMLLQSAYGDVKEEPPELVEARKRMDELQARNESLQQQLARKGGEEYERQRGAQEKVNAARDAERAAQQKKSTTRPGRYGGAYNWPSEPRQNPR